MNISYSFLLCSTTVVTKKDVFFLWKCTNAICIHHIYPNFLMCTIIMVNLKTISFVLLFFFGMAWLCSLSLSFSRKAGHVSQDGVPKLTTGWEIEMDSKEFKISFCTPFLHHTFCLLHKIRLIRFICNYFHRNF